MQLPFECIIMCNEPFQIDRIPIETLRTRAKRAVFFALTCRTIYKRLLPKLTDYHQALNLAKKYNRLERHIDDNGNMSYLFDAVSSGINLPFLKRCFARDLGDLVGEVLIAQELTDICRFFPSTLNYEGMLRCREKTPVVYLILISPMFDISKLAELLLLGLPLPKKHEINGIMKDFLVDVKANLANKYNGHEPDNIKGKMEYAAEYLSKKML